MASAAADATKKAAQAAATAAQQTYHDLKAAPSVVLCTKCNVDVPVPAELWKWTCEPNKHANIWDAPECSVCKFPRPKDLANPTVECGTCHLVITVPTSNFSRYAREGGHKTAAFVQKTAQSTKAFIEHQASAPDTFHCAHCDALLAVPTGQWACQTCTFTNEEAAKACVKCSQKKGDQKAICGVCGQSTEIPSSNFVDSLKHNARDVSLSSKKLYLDVSGKPYTTCPQCKTHIRVEAPAVSPAAAADLPSNTPPSGEGNANDPVVAEGAGSNVKQVECPQCKHKFDRVQQ